MHPAFKFLALGEIQNVEIVAMAVGITPFSGLSTSPSGKNLKSHLNHVNADHNIDSKNSLSYAHQTWRVL
jgi:hypothetical protein